MKGLIGLFLMLSCQLYGQDQAITEAFLYGTWPVTEAQASLDEVPEAAQSEFLMLMEILENAVFIFREDHTCDFSCPIEELSYKNRKWELDTETQAIKIYASGYHKEALEMLLTLKREPSKTYFILEDGPLPLTLTVTQQ